MFLPSTPDEVSALGWDRLDVVLVTGDAYVDSPYVGVSVIGQVLLASGYRVGIIGQPDIASVRDIGRLGEPALFWGVTGGCIDSLVANTTASRRRKRAFSRQRARDMGYEKAIQWIQDGALEK